MGGENSDFHFSHFSRLSHSSKGLKFVSSMNTYLIYHICRNWVGAPSRLAKTAKCLIFDWVPTFRTHALLRRNFSPSVVVAVTTIADETYYSVENHDLSSFGERWHMFSGFVFWFWVSHNGQGHKRSRVGWLRWAAEGNTVTIFERRDRMKNKRRNNVKASERMCAEGGAGMVT